MRNVFRRQMCALGSQLLFQDCPNLHFYPRRADYSYCTLMRYFRGLSRSLEIVCWHCQLCLMYDRLQRTLGHSQVCESIMVTSQASAQEAQSWASCFRSYFILGKDQSGSKHSCYLLCCRNQRFRIHLHSYLFFLPMRDALKANWL